MTGLKELKKEVEDIKNRNRRVEQDKRWETSTTRKFLLASFTYLTVGLFLNAMNVPDSWLNAVVPSIGFLLSTLTMSFFKKLWSKYADRENSNFSKNSHKFA